MHVRENRKRCAAALGLDPGRLVVPRQSHSSRIVHLERLPDGPVEADGLVVTGNRLSAGVMTADCMPLLLAEPSAGIVCAVHAGWRGAYSGIIANAVEKILFCGGKPEKIIAALGPCLRQTLFEVGQDVYSAFAGKYPCPERFFAPGKNTGKYMFDPAAFAAWSLAEYAVCNFHDTGVCTLEKSGDYFSYRAACLHERNGRNTAFGRNLSVIAMQ